MRVVKTIVYLIKKAILSGGSHLWTKLRPEEPKNLFF